MRGGRVWGAVVGAMCLALLMGCTTSDDDAADDDAANGDDTEVAGAVLERDEDGEPAPVDDPDDDRVDPREGTSSDEIGDEPEEPEEPEETEDPAEPDTADPIEADPAEVEPESGPGQEPRNGSGTDRTERTPEPTLPQPLRLSAGAGIPGDAVGFGQGGAEVLVGGPIESPPPPGVRSDALRRPNGADEVRCETVLQAPQDRGLVARGELTVDLLVEDHDGTERRRGLMVMDLDVELEVAERFALPATSWRPFDRDEVASMWCEASFAPA